MKEKLPALKKHRLSNAKKNFWLYIMLIPSFVTVCLFMYYPMYGLIIAFKDYVPAVGIWESKFVGLKWLKMMFSSPDFGQIMYNTIVISGLKIVCGTIFTVFVALLLNELSHGALKKGIQTLIYFPSFVSWIVIGGVFLTLLGSTGVINQTLEGLGMSTIGFLTDSKIFPGTLVITDIWKSFGYGTIIYTAAIASIDTGLFEAIAIDGGGRLRQIWHIVLPGMRPTIVLIATLKLRDILNAGFDQIIMLYNPQVYSTGDVIDTYVYRAGLLGAQFSFGTAVGLFKGIMGLILLFIAYKAADKLVHYKIF